MAAKRETPTPGPVPGASSSVGDDDTDELTEDRTIEFDIDAAEADIEAVAGAAVAAEIHDKSTGAATPRELATRRGRRNTLVSPIPSLLAKSMRPAPAAAAPARPASATAPVQAIPGEQESGGYSIEIANQSPNVHSAPTAEQPIPRLGPVGILVGKARFCLDSGDIAEAVLAASAAIFANEKSPEADVGDLSDTAGGPLARIFIAGPVSKVPVMNRSDAELDTAELDELHWALLRRMNGHLTLDEVFRATKIPAIDALKIAASLLRDGVIRVKDRTRA
jgi:hypothetical protein